MMLCYGRTSHPSDAPLSEITPPDHGHTTGLSLQGIYYTHLMCTLELRRYVQCINILAIVTVLIVHHICRYKYVCDKSYRCVAAITFLPLLPKLVPSYCPGEEQFIEVGVKAALRDVLHKGVLLYVFHYTTQFGCSYCLPVHTCTCSSMEPLFESPKLDDVLRALVRQTFPEFYPQGMYSKNLLVYKISTSFSFVERD